MAFPTTYIPPLDPNLFTGPMRLVGPVGRVQPVVLDTHFGATGVPEYGRWLLCGVAGTVRYIDWAGNTVDLPLLVAGVWHPVMATMVLTAGTGATGLVWGS